MAEARHEPVTVDVVLLTLSQDEAQTLRQVLGATVARYLDDSGLTPIYEAIEPLTEFRGLGKYEVHVRPLYAAHPDHDDEVL